MVTFCLLIEFVGSWDKPKTSRSRFAADLMNAEMVITEVVTASCTEVNHVTGIKSNMRQRK